MGKTGRPTKEQQIKNAIRDDGIRKLVKRGMGVNKVAKLYKITRIRVWQICKSKVAVRSI